MTQPLTTRVSAATPEGVRDVTLPAPDNAISTLCGELCFAWSGLDYVLRIAIKRLSRLSLQDVNNHKIMYKYNHSNCIDEINNLLNKLKDCPSTQELKKIIEEIGASRDDEKLYARRNEIIHSAFFSTQDGEILRARIGAGDQSNVKSVDYPQLKKEIQSLISEIKKTTDNILILSNKILSEKALSSPEQHSTTSC